jgi:hypothetical protein
MRKMLLIMLTALGVLSCAIGLHSWNYYNPAYHGKRLNAWADQAMWDPDPAVRREALPQLGEEQRTSLLMRVVGNSPLPPEMLPFLLDDLVTDEHRDSYVALGLSRVTGSDTVPALVALLRDDVDPLVRDGAVCALSQMDARAKAALQEEFLRVKGTEFEDRVALTLKKLDPAAAVP